MQQRQQRTNWNGRNLELPFKRKKTTQLTLRRSSWADGGVRESTKRLD
ncbi:hypothetical protein SynRS9907_00678 [Synechococcus sp. RS9907]|nr:hypothetical protein SynRS9907_00678 [Synechococcus sp. RS9907]